MGYYVLRQEEEFVIESPNHILKVFCDKTGDIKMTRLERNKTVSKKVYVNRGESK